MSVVIAIKENDRVVVGCDARVSGKLDYVDYLEKVQKGRKLDNGIVVACVGNGALLEVCCEELKHWRNDEDISREILSRDILIHFMEAYHNTSLVDNDGALDGSLLVAKDNKAFILCGNGTIEEVYH